VIKLKKTFFGAIMKKIILSLFLVIGIISFSAPNFIDINKIEKMDIK
jgi:hypothetical protein